MKKILMLVGLMIILLFSCWTGLNHIVKQKEGFYYVNSTFAIMNKSLFLKQNEYSKRQKLDQSMLMSRENGVRELYLELVPGMKQKPLTRALEAMKPYGFELGFWYNLNRGTVPTDIDILDLILIAYDSNKQTHYDIYFLFTPTREELNKFKDTYIHMIAEVTQSLQKSQAEHPFTLNIGWILHSSNDMGVHDTTFNNYNKRFHFHVLDIADMVAIIPKNEEKLAKQVLNDLIYAKRKEKQVHMTFTDSLLAKFDRNQLLDTVLQESQELVLLNHQSQILFLDQIVMIKIVQQKYDLNDDGKVDIRDLIIFGKQYVTGNASPIHDFNKDGIVNLYDFISIFINMKNTGWEGRDRTYEYQSQSLGPYHLATSQHV